MLLQANLEVGRRRSVIRDSPQRALVKKEDAEVNRSTPFRPPRLDWARRVDPAAYISDLEFLDDSFADPC